MRAFSWSIAFSALVFGCNREVPTQAEPLPTVTKTAEVAPSGGPSVSPLAPIAPTVLPAPTTSTLVPVASASSSAFAPAPISPADLEKAKKYVSGLSRGRKATAAKQYAAATKGFDDALAAEPGDARALSERGYALLLLGELDAAAKDLEEAAKHATSTELLRQILYNQATLAEKKGDTGGAAALRARRDELAGAKRSKSKDCSVSITRPGRQPIVFNTFKDAWKEIKTAHFRHWGNQPDELESPVIDDKASEEVVRKALIGNATGDGAWVITTAQTTLQVSHVIFVRGKKIYLLEDLGGYQMGRCPFGESPPKIVEGDVPRIQVDTEYHEMGYMCEAPPPEHIRPCSEMQDGNPVQSYCYWTGSKFRTMILDPKTLTITLEVEESVEATGTTTFDVAQPRVVVTQQQDAVLVTGCGVDKRESIP